ncbi:MAG: cytochrome c [Nitrospira sp.]|nr:cytochrome c [Nitrospira sp.]
MKRYAPTAVMREAMPSSEGASSTSEPLLVLLLLIGSGAVLVLAQTTEALDRGRNIYRERCLECHGASVKASFLSPRQGTLVSAATSAKTDTERWRVIAEGKARTAMPAWKGLLSGEDHQAVLHYIRALIRFTPPLTSPSATP